ncbi:MAG: nuclear transport factor 2 family protein [Acidimicrobiales bacterium]
MGEDGRMGDAGPVGDDASVTTMEALAAQVRVALGEADLSAYAELLHPDVHWGPPGARRATCRNRGDVLAWYGKGKEAGVRADVSDVVVLGDRLLVSLMVRGAAGAEQSGPAVPRWQVLTVEGAHIVDIVGFDDRDEAVAFAGEPPSTPGRRRS